MQDKLKEFLIKAKANGYADEKTPIINESDGSFSNRFTDSEWAFHDNWFGGEPFGGREVVYVNKKPYWMMVYYGSDSQEVEGVIPFLRNSLSHMPSDFPTRGPKEYSDNDFLYRNSWDGDIEQFKGKEEIFYKGKIVYSAEYSGGLVNQRD